MIVLLVLFSCNVVFLVIVAAIAGVTVDAVVLYSSVLTIIFLVLFSL